MEITAQKVLLVDDELPMRRLAEQILRRPDRTFFHAADGTEAMEIAFSEKPDIILLDHLMPRKSGIEVCEEIRANPFTAHTPIIMVTAAAEVEQRVAMMRAGCDDVVAKPYAPQELAARVEMVLARTERELATDSLTRLPGNNPTREEIRRRMDAGEPFALCYLDLDKFKAYVDYYGFERASGVIEQVARMIEQALAECGQPDDFVGHIGGDDFVAVTTPDRARPICERCVAIFDERIPEFYDQADRERGYIVSRHRTGEKAQFKLMTISAAMVSSDEARIESPHELAELVADLKAQAKAVDESIVVEYRAPG
ncbi:MAG: response regulator [Armatimonadota bacterium]